EAEMKVALALIDLLEEEFDITKYHDEYRDALTALIQAKLDGQEFVAPEEPVEAAPPVDLMAALKASVEDARSRKGEKAEEEAGEKEKPARRRKSAAKAS